MTSKFSFKLVKMLIFSLVLIYGVMISDVFSDNLYLNVPVYDQNILGYNDKGCSPTAAGMILGWWDYDIWTDMIPNGSPLYSSNPTGVAATVDQLAYAFDFYEHTPYGTYDEDIVPGLEIVLEDKYPNWHFKIVSETASSADDVFNIIKASTDNLCPVMFNGDPGVWVYYPNGGNGQFNCKHSMAAVGYSDDNSVRKIFVNTTYTTEGDTATFYCDTGFDYTLGSIGLITIIPSGPGFYEDGFHVNENSQAFLDCFEDQGGENVYGHSFDNGGTAFVHAYPDDNTIGYLYVQNFLYTDAQSNETDYLMVYNDDLDEAYSLVGQILDYWTVYSGYSLFGAPTEFEHTEVDINSNSIVVQEFQLGSTYRNIGYCSSTQWSGEYILGNGNYIPAKLVYNDVLDESYYVTDKILEFWLIRSDVNEFWMPTGVESNEVDDGSNSIVVQGFQLGGSYVYIGHCSSTQWSGFYTYGNGVYSPVDYGNIENMISMVAVPDYISSGSDAFAYLGSNPMTDQPVVSIIDPSTENELKIINFFDGDARPKFITILPDMNGNGKSEVHVTAYDVTNLQKLTEIRDSGTGALIQ